MQPKLPLPPAVIAAHLGRITPLVERFEKEKKLHHSLLFTGLAGAGKREIVTHFIQILFCDRSPFAAAVEESGGLFGDAFAAPAPTSAGQTPCGECASCKRAQDGQWLDLFWFDPEKADEEKLGVHKINTFRELKGKLGFGPTEEPFKVVVITEAERMTIPTANSILKILEEPPPNWIFILTASDTTKVLPTLISRCIEIKIAPLTVDQIYETLKLTQGAQFHSKTALIAARAGLGSLSRAQYFLEEETWKARDLILGLLSNPAAEWMKLVDQMALSQRQLSLGLDLLESVISDLLHYRVQGAGYEWIHSDQKDFLTQWANQRGLSAEHLAELLSQIADKRRYVGYTLNAKLLAQETLVPVLESLFPHD